MLNQFLDHLYRQITTHRANYAEHADLRILMSDDQQRELRYLFSQQGGDKPWAPREEDYTRTDRESGRIVEMMGVEVVTTADPMRPPMVVRLAAI